MTNTYHFFHEEDGGPKKVGPPIFIGWKNAKVFVKFLQTFYDVTLKLIAILSVTSNIYYHEICEIQSQLIEMWSSGDTLLSKMAIGMQKKFDKYWGTINGFNQFLYISAVLDPKYKIRYLKYCFGCLYDVDTTTSLSNKVIKILTDLYAFYCMGKGKPIMNSGSGSLLSSFVKHLEEKSHIDKRNDLDLYSADDNIDPLTSNFDILA
ncbi:hypothetical protein UlMin_041244 [Ulmus minor]